MPFENFFNIKKFKSYNPKSFYRHGENFRIDKRWKKNMKMSENKNSRKLIAREKKKLLLLASIYIIFDNK